MKVRLRPPPGRESERPKAAAPWANRRTRVRPQLRPPTRPRPGPHLDPGTLW